MAWNCRGCVVLGIELQTHPAEAHRHGCRLFAKGGWGGNDKAVSDVCLWDDLWQIYRTNARCRRFLAAEARNGRRNIFDAAVSHLGITVASQ